MNVRRTVTLILIACALFGGKRFSPNFLDIHYLLDMVTLSVETGIVALAMTFVISTGNIDLSVASTLSLTACLTAKLLETGYSPWIAIAFALAVGTGLGSINGILITRLKLPSFLVTLGTMATYRGIAQAMLGPNSVKLPSGFIGLDQRLVLGVPAPIWILIGLAAVAAVGMASSVFGRWSVAVGSNESAAFYSAIPVNRVKLTVFALAGFAAGVGALLMDSRLGVARHDLAKGLELDSITMVVVGGTAIAGGNGDVPGTVLAMILIAVLRAAMEMANVKAEYQLTAIGILLIVAVLFSRSDLSKFFRQSSPSKGDNLKTQS